MRYQAIMFDLDGTLLDTLEDLADSMNAALTALGMPTHPTESYKTMVGDGIVNLARRALPPDRLDEQLLRTCVAQMREQYAKRWAAKTRPYPGIPELLDELQRRGLKMAVLSNKPDDFTKLTVKRLLPRWRFHAVLGEGPQTPTKPNPAGALAAARELGVPPTHFLYLGDTATDMQTALAAGMFPVGALWGFRIRQELLAAGARALIERPAELLELL